MFDVTPIENMFLMEYLPTAPGDYLRVYLYARMVCLHPGLGSDLSGMARALCLDEETVYSAFTYWEHQGLVMRLSDNPPTYDILPLRNGSACVISPMDKDYYEYREYNSSLQAMFGGDEIIQPKEYRMANDWLNVYGFHQDAALRMMEYMVSLNPKKTIATVFKHAQKQALEWADEGIKTLEEVERAIAEGKTIGTTAREILKRFGMRRNPTQDEKDCVKRWLKDWDFTREQILDACAETIKSRNPSFGYLNGILESRFSGSDDNRDELVQALKQLGAYNTVPTPEEQKQYSEWLKRGFEPEAIELAAIRCNLQSKNRFEDLKWMLDEWTRHKLFTRMEAEAYIQDLEKRTAEAGQVFAKCGMINRPGQNALQFYESWKAKYSLDLINFAAECARGMAKPMLYMDKTLAAWEAGGVSTLEEAKAQHEASRQSRNSPAQANINPALNYDQRTYTNEDFGDDFFIDLDKEYGNGGGKS